MTPILAIACRLRPQRLRHQVLLLVAAIMAVTMGLLFHVSTLRLIDVGVESSRDWAESVGRAAAGAAADALAAGDRAALERALHDFAALHGVARIDVLDAEGKPRLSLLASRQGQVRIEHLPAAVPREAPADGVLAWSGVGARGRLGSVGVTLALEGEREHLRQLRWDTVMAIAFAGLITLIAVHLLLARAMAPLQRVAAFSRALADGSGDRLEGPTGSLEVSELSDALNEASRLLRERLESLRIAEDRSQAIVHAVPDAVFGFSEDGLIAIASPAVASIFGAEPEAVIGKPVGVLMPGLDVASAERRTVDEGLYMRSSQTHVSRYATTASRHDGTRFPVEVSLTRAESASGVRYVCVVRDATEKQMTDEMLNLYGRALGCTSSGIVISDMSLPGHPVFYANAAFETITGYLPGDAIGRNCAFLQRDDTAQPEIDVLRRAVAEGRSARVVLRNYRKDGSLFFNQLSISPVTTEDGRVRHYVGVLDDVTERERARMAIAERSARLNAVFDLSPDGFVVFDREDRLVFCNHAFQRMTGWTDGERIAGMSADEFDRRFALLCEAGTSARPSAQVLHGEADDGVAEVITLQSPLHRVLARVARRQTEGNGESILFFRDITHETEVDRMKSEFLTTAAHELRTPMVSVFGFTELLLNRPVSEGRRRDVLETIHRQAQLLIHMVNELLDLARIEARQGKDLMREPHPLGRLIDGVVSALDGHDAARPVRLRVSHGRAQVHVDAEKFHRALGNVLSNAFKYSPEGGDVAITTHEGMLDDVPAVGVRVADQGIGMTQAQVARVFERFYRADPSGNIPGTGLGMSLVKEIVELHGGRVDVDSEAGRGTSVTLWLPLSAIAVAPATLPV